MIEAGGVVQKFILTFTAIFAALDIIGAIPMYLGLTRTMSPRKRQETINTSMWVAFAVALVFLIFGNTIFRYLGISLFDFRIAGGLVLLLVSLTDLAGKPEVEKRASGSTGVVPLAVPLITGPGVLTTLILQAAGVGYLMTAIALMLNYLLAWLVLRRSEWIARLIGQDGTVVISKVAALLLAAIAVAMIRGGLFDAIRAFKG